MHRIRMDRILSLALGTALAASVVAVPAAAQEAGAGERITIMVPDLAPLEGARDNFGEDVAEELRDLIGELHTHQTVSGRDIRRARREYDLSAEQLYNCVSARQLAMRMNWGLVLCGEYTPAGNGQVHVNAKFVGSSDGNEFAVPEFTVGDRQSDQAAQTILQTFDQWQTQLRHTVFCQQYMDSQSWDRALENCNTALDINPTSTSALYKKAYIHREMEQYDEALATLDRLLEIDPIDQDALKLAGIVSAQAAQPEQAREYFDRYMELNPNDVGVRLQVATDIANAGDPATAMAFAREGLEVAPEDMTLITYIGHFAAQAAGKAETDMNAQRQGQAPAGPAVDSARVQELYQQAAEMYRRVYEEMGDSTETQILERLIIADFKLGEYEDAIALGEAATEIAPENPAIWDAYSRALQEAGRNQEALAALERTEELGRNSSALTQRKAMLQLAMGHENEAVQALVEGVESGQFEPQNAFNIVFGHAYTQKFQRGQMEEAYALLDAAGPLAQTEKDRLTRNFWRGYIRFEQAKVAHEPMTAQSAARAKPLFEQALELFQAAQGYEQYHASANVPQLIDNVQRFIQIEEALIQRGR